MQNIKKLRKDRNQWLWERDGKTYFTNKDGYNLFVENKINDYDVEHKQISATFSLVGYSMSGARKKLNRNVNN